MKRSFTSYATSLSGQDIDILEAVIYRSYKNFIHFYRMVEEISDEIESLEYEFADEKTLSLDMILTSKSDVKELKARLKGNLDESAFLCDMKVRGSRIKIKLQSL